LRVRTLPPGSRGLLLTRHQGVTLLRDLPELCRMIQALGYLAALFSTCSFTPQAWKIIQSRDTKSISTGMYVLTVGAFALWLAFGILERQWPLVLSNGICLVLSSFILIMKLLPAREKATVANAMTPK
jgi:MtN3 and saliva related transmembrane protein